MDNIDEFTSQIGLNQDQAAAVKKYIKELLLTSLKSMKDEYNSEIDQAISDLEQVKVQK